jgi:serine/threonine protein kinase
MRGGKLLGKGGYGCVFSPAIRCKGHTVPMPDTVSKVMSEEDAKEEYKIHTMIRSIDGRKRFFVTTDMEPCLIEQTAEEAIENPIQGCVKPDKVTKIMPQIMVLQLPHGGESWDTFVPADTMTFFRSWIHLFEAVEQLHRYEMAHMDLKFENIVTNDRYQNRLIDFGFAFSPDSFQETIEYMELFTRVNYYPWPYEVKCLDSRFQLKDITKKSIDMFYRESVHKHSGSYPSDIYYTDLGQMIVDEVYARKLYTTLFRLSRKEQLLFLSRAIDVYALGRLLSRMYVKLTGHIPRRHTVMLEKRGSEEYTLFPKHPDFEIVKKQSIPFFDLVRKMMNLDPFQRIRITEAKEEFKKLAFFDGYVFPEQRPLPPSPSPSPKTRRGGSNRKNRVRRTIRSVHRMK